MITDRELLDFYKELVANVIANVTRAAQEQGSSIPELHRALMIETMALSAHMHTGTDDSFFALARHSLALVRTGVVEQ